MSDLILEARNISFSYEDGKPALDNVSFEVHKGERIAVLGPNGAGKSTFFLCLVGVLSPQKGELLLYGKPVGRKNRRSLCETAGIVFQNADDQIIASTVAGEVSFGPMNLKLPKEEVESRVGRALEYMGLQPFRRRPPHELSGGEKKRVTIADILAMENEIMLFDEPGASLDPKGMEQLETVLGRLSGEGRTLVTATHDMDFAFRWATRVAVFIDGKIIADGLPETVFKDENTLFKANLRKPVMFDVFEILKKHGLVKKEAACPKTTLGLDEILSAAGQCK